jgi:hypothetical protein
METDRAKEIIRSLADGRDPATRQPFPPDSPYQQADTVRALYVALEALERGGRARAPKPVDPNKPKMGAAWTPEEEQQLRSAFASHKPVQELAATHGRTQGAITARLMRMGLIEDTGSNRPGQGNRPTMGLPGRKTDGMDRGPMHQNPTMPPDRPVTPPRALTQAEIDDLPF